MRDCIESYKVGNNTVEIVYDEDPISPRENDNVTSIYHWHRRYDLGNQIERFSQEEMLNDLTERGDTVLAIAPLYLYDHGGISLSVNCFGDRWDSGQVGWVVITQFQADDMGITDRSLDNLMKIIELEIEEYNQYLNGEIYGFRVYDAEMDLVESCYGYYSISAAKTEAGYYGNRDYRPRGITNQACV